MRNENGLVGYLNILTIGLRLEDLFCEGVALPEYEVRQFMTVLRFVIGQKRQYLML